MLLRADALTREPVDAFLAAARAALPDSTELQIAGPMPAPMPLRAGRPALGTWQGIYLCEHRDRGGPRSIVATAFGEGG